MAGYMEIIFPQRSCIPVLANPVQSNLVHVTNDANDAPDGRKIVTVTTTTKRRHDAGKLEIPGHRPKSDSRHPV